MSSPPIKNQESLNVGKWPELLLKEYLGNFTVDGQKDIRMSQRNPSSNNTLTFLIIQDIAIVNGKNGNGKMEKMEMEKIIFIIKIS